MDREPDSDLVLWFLRAMCDRLKVPTNDVLELEREARIYWGGKRPYIAKKTQAPRAAAPAGRDRPRG